MDQDIFNKVMDALDVAYNYKFSNHTLLTEPVSKNNVKKNAYGLRKLVEVNSEALAILKKMADRGLVNLDELGIEDTSTEDESHPLT
jgi:hypothetical protein